MSDPELSEIDTAMLEKYQRHRLRKVCQKCGAEPRGGQAVCGKCQGPIGTQVALSTITRDLNVKRAGIPVVDAAGRRLWIHSFRHTYCTLLSQQIANAWQRKEILGHAKLSTTERYTHVEARIIPLTAIALLPAEKPEDKAQPARVEPLEPTGTHA